MTIPRQTNIPNIDRTARNPIPFPDRLRAAVRCSDSVEIAALALDLADRRMQQLAQSLGCLGYFEDEGDGPRAA